MRDSWLIELICELAENVAAQCGDECNKCVHDLCVGRLADHHLLAEGVIVPPCKVGDTVYCIWQYSDFAKEEAPFIKEEKVFSFILDEGETKVIPEGYGDMTDRWYRLLSVHFTREEAEKALTERSENDT